MAKLGEAHTFECDVCGKIVVNKSRELPPKWCEAVLSLNRNYTSSTYLMCEKHNNGNSWKENRRSAFRILLAKWAPCFVTAAARAPEKDPT